MNLFSIWLKELKSFFSIWREELNLSCFPIWLKELNFFKMLKELNLSSVWITFLHDSNWTLFWWIVSQLSHDAFTCHALPSNRVESKKSRIFHKKWLKVLNTFLNLTERVELFLHWTQRIELFFNHLTQRIEPFFVWVPNWIFFLKKKPSQKMTQRIEPSFVFFNDSKNWTLCKWLIELSLFYEPLLNKSWIFLFLTQRIELFLNMTQRIEPTFFECDFFFLKKKTQKIELFSKNDSNNWTFLNMTQWIELALNDSKNWTCLFQHDSENCFFLNLLKFFFTGLEESNPFVQYDSTNRTPF